MALLVLVAVIACAIAGLYLDQRRKKGGWK
jgi:hypothetical protein